MFHGTELNRNINHIHESPYSLPVKITIPLSMVHFLRRISSAFTIVTFRVYLLIELFKVKETFSIQ